MAYDVDGSPRMYRMRRCPDCEALPNWPHSFWCEDFIGPITAHEATMPTGKKKLVQPVATDHQHEQRMAA